jgi:programmed cell death protein 5
MTANQDDELAALRAQRLKQLQDQLQQQANQQLEAEEQAQKQAVQTANVDAILRRHLSSDARARLTRIGLVEPQRANAIKADLAAMLEQGSINTPMSDAALKQVLAQLSKSRSNASVRRI